jgi:predicted nicotinamide N-methyase
VSEVTRWPAIGFQLLANGDRVPVILETVPLGPDLPAIGIERPEDPPSLLQDWCNKADPSLRIPYWAELWPSSRAIARRLAAGEPLEGREVLDLGCGLGLAGIAAGLRGAIVTFADYHPDALVFARRNAARAGLSAASFLPADWREPHWAKPYDLVLGADVIYDRSEHEPIHELLGQLLARGGRAWLGDPCRDIATPFLEEWVRRGHLLETFRLGPVPGEDVPIAIHELAIGAGRAEPPGGARNA